MDSQQSGIINKIDKMLQSYQNIQSSKDKKFIESLPQQFINFLMSKNIKISQLLIPIPRYIRIKPNFNLTLEQLCSSFKIPEQHLIKIDEQFYALPSEVKINNNKYYQNGLIYGMDYSSCIPARCLDVKEGMKVLELCSAPGNKSMYIADNLKQVNITGVQISINRANIMKNLIKKYGLDNKIQVKVQDGLTFVSQIKYDRVLIDAQCTHEGSIKHIKKFTKNPQAKKNQIKQNKQLSFQQKQQFKLNNSNIYTSEITKLNQWSFQDFKQRFLDEKKLNNLNSLQLGLLENGFKLLKDGGILVYSTCSFDQEQNQDIIKLFLQKNSNAKLKNCKQGLVCAVDYQKGRFNQCIKFKPSVSRCGGMFICKIQKIKQEQKSIIIEKNQKIQQKYKNYIKQKNQQQKQQNDNQIKLKEQI